MLERDQEPQALTIADEVWAHAENGWLPYTFDTSPSTSGQIAPWHSALTQGEALGLFAMLDQLERAAAVYRTLSQGSQVIADDGWLLEYVDFPPVLNGAIFAIAGLYEYWEKTRDPEVAATMEGSIVAVARDIHRFRNPGRVSSYMRDGDFLFLGYHRLHIVQLKIMAELSGMECFRQAAEDFAADA